METTISVYNQRKDEIELYFSAINELYGVIDSIDDEEKMDFHKDEFIKILKSNILIMIYNLVESSVMGGILEIYEELKSQNLSYQTVSNEIKKIWFSFIFNQVYDKTAHYNSYKDKASQMISSILGNEPIVLDRKAADISGNLDAEKIRQVCSSHGISFNIPSNCQGGFVLGDVKEKRNQLAHGTLSFVECGRNYTINDLEKIKNDTNIFLEALLNDMKIYYDNQKYKAVT